MSVVLQDQLFEVAKGPPVSDLLADLDCGLEGVRCKGLLTLLALLIYYLKLDNHSLLQNARIRDLLLHCDFDPDTARMLLRPNERGVHEPDILANAFARTLR